MGPAIFLIAIMGCGEGSDSCQPVRTLETRFESEAQCLAATEAALENNMDVDYPVVVAQCTAGDKPPQVVKASAVKLPEPEATEAFSTR